MDGRAGGWAVGQTDREGERERDKEGFCLPCIFWLYNKPLSIPFDS